MAYGPKFLNNAKIKLGDFYPKAQCDRECEVDMIYTPHLISSPPLRKKNGREFRPENIRPVFASLLGCD